MRSKAVFLVTLLFGAIVLSEIVADLSGKYRLVYCLKPMIMLTLIGYTKIVADEHRVDKCKWFIAGMLFALLGDVLLMIREKDLFIPGLGAFLLMQLCYGYSFYSEVKIRKNLGTAMFKMIPFLAYVAIFAFILVPHLESPLKLPVIIYACCIGGMAWLSFLRKQNVHQSSYAMVFAGAILFVTSDSLIAIDRFLKPIPLGTLWVMSTYASAQYFIVFGFLKTK